MFEKIKEQDSALTNYLMEVCSNAVKGEEWREYEVKVVFKGRRLVKGFEVRELRATAKTKRRQGNGNEPEKI